MNDNFQDKPPEKVLDDGKSMMKYCKSFVVDDQITRKGQKIEHMKNSVDKKINNYLKGKREKVDVNVGGKMSPKNKQK